MPDLSIALCLRDDETRLPDMARAAAEVAQILAAELEAGEWHDATALPLVPQEREKALIGGDLANAEREGDLDEDPDMFSYELLALDQSSRDNTLSVLSILHAKLPELRSIQELEPGTAIRQAARHARGRVWLIVDAPFDIERGLWAARQVFCGDRAALVPGEVLAVHRSLGQAALGWLDGGLVSAQREVEAMLRAHDQRPAWSPPRDRRVKDRARLLLRRSLSRLGMPGYDRAP
ncbi:MAG: hypothetical protein KC457_20740 [Myxococcales bacterium]|nr:hypothetical protein [Myxococcales bacterium]